MKQFTMTANGFKNALSKPMVVVRMSAHAAALVASFTFLSMSSMVATAAEAAVNINRDSPEVMADGLAGVGIAKAYRIVEYRETYGPFESIEELAEVNGIGSATIERNREQLVIE